jgi:hypothetical protein
LDSSVEPDCASPEAPEKMSAAVAATAHFLHRLILIDTTPDRIAKMPRVGEGTWDATARRREDNRTETGWDVVSRGRTASYEGSSSGGQSGFRAGCVSAKLNPVS